MKPEKAKASVRPGDVITTVGGHVVRAAELEEDGITGVRQARDGDALELTVVAYMDVDGYHPRESDPDPSAILEEVDVEEVQTDDAGDDTDDDPGHAQRVNAQLAKAEEEVDDEEEA